MDTIENKITGKKNTNQLRTNNLFGIKDHV